MSPRVVIVGLGPAGPDLVTTGTLQAIERVGRRFVRTSRHPAAEIVTGATTFDHVYESAATLEEVYRRIVDELVEAATAEGEVLYAVPGSPVVAERTVERLLADDRIEAEVVPALSFVDLTWARLGIDPMAVSVRIVDGHRFSIDAAGERGPLLVAQCDRASVMSDIKLAVDEPPAEAVTVLARLGLPDESITQVTWDDLDRIVEPDHLTSLWIPEMTVPVAAEVQRFDELVARLRVECPWDREQTHRSLSRHLLEEAHEVLEVLDRFPDTAGVLGAPAEGLDDEYHELEEELGDLLFQICFHTRLAGEAGRFTLADVARGIHDKLVGRHPHVFGEVDATTPEAVIGNWEQIKRAEKGRDSTFDGIPRSLPALAFATKLYERARRAGLSEQVDDILGKDLDAAGAESIRGQLLSVAIAAHQAGLDPEAELRTGLASLLAQLRRLEAQDR